MMGAGGIGVAVRSSTNLFASLSNGVLCLRFSFFPSLSRPPITHRQASNLRFGPSGSTTCPTPNKVRRGAPLSTRSTPSKISRGENRTVFEVEQTKNWAPHTNCSTLAEMAIASIVHLYVFPAKPYELMGTTSLKIFQFLETILLIVLLSLM
ncbi:hypothetical protein CFP56_043053 [Quercus suber]|uniref:Uncharacterized protein n=1 Tax=Quercus suber TaxID=58331 RepID=A0AAW0ISL7_QUESU